MQKYYEKQCNLTNWIFIPQLSASLQQLAKNIDLDNLDDEINLDGLSKVSLEDICLFLKAFFKETKAAICLSCWI